MADLVAALHSGKVLVMDGAMGTELQRLTHSPDLARGPLLNLTDPALVRSIHRAYLDAGADVLLTNTFRAPPLGTIWKAAIELGQSAEARPAFVLADIGPTANLTDQIAADLLAECVGVDGVLLETWTSFADLTRFAERARIPLLVSFTFQRGDRARLCLRDAVGQPFQADSQAGKPDLQTFDGARPEDCARAAQEYGAVAVGANCGKEIGMGEMLEIVRRYRDVCDLPIFVRPNAGTPMRKESGWAYPLSPEEMAAGVKSLLAEGIAMIGGCCGTTPAHIRAIRMVVDEWNARAGRRER